MEIHKNFSRISTREREFDPEPVDSLGEGWVLRHIPRRFSSPDDQTPSLVRTIYYSPLLKVKFDCISLAKKFITCIKKCNGDEAAATHMLSKKLCIKKLCSEVECDNWAVTAGKCSLHGPRCSVEGCTNGVRSKGLCQKHGKKKEPDAASTNDTTASSKKKTKKKISSVAECALAALNDDCSSDSEDSQNSSSVTAKLSRVTPEKIASDGNIVALSSEMKTRVKSFVSDMGEEGTTIKWITSAIKGFSDGCKGMDAHDVLRANLPELKTKLSKKKNIVRYYLSNGEVEIDEKSNMSAHKSTNPRDSSKKKEKKTIEAADTSEDMDISDEEGKDAQPNKNTEIALLPPEMKAQIILFVLNKKGRGARSKRIWKAVSGLRQICDRKEMDAVLQANLSDELCIKSVSDGKTRYFLSETLQNQSSEVRSLCTNLKKGALIKLNPDQVANKTPFPIGCSVTTSIKALHGEVISIYTGGGSGYVYEIDTAASTSRSNNEDASKMLIDEHQLEYAPTTPIYFKSSVDEVQQEGLILDSDSSNGGLQYTVWLTETKKKLENVLPGKLSYRVTNKIGKGQVKSCGDKERAKRNVSLSSSSEEGDKPTDPHAAPVGDAPNKSNTPSMATENVLPYKKETLIELTDKAKNMTFPLGCPVVSSSDGREGVVVGVSLSLSNGEGVVLYEIETVTENNGNDVDTIIVKEQMLSYSPATQVYFKSSSEAVKQEAIILSSSRDPGNVLEYSLRLPEKLKTIDGVASSQLFFRGSRKYKKKVKKGTKLSRAVSSASGEDGEDDNSWRLKMIENNKDFNMISRDGENWYWDENGRVYVSSEVHHQRLVGKKKSCTPGKSKAKSNEEKERKNKMETGSVKAANAQAIVQSKGINNGPGLASELKLASEKDGKKDDAVEKRRDGKHKRLGIDNESSNDDELVEKNTKLPRTGAKTKKSSKKRKKGSGNEVKNGKKHEYHYHCAICNVNCTSESGYQLHLNGKGHKKKMTIHDASVVQGVANQIIADEIVEEQNKKFPKKQKKRSGKQVEKKSNKKRKQAANAPPSNNKKKATVAGEEDISG